MTTSSKQSKKSKQIRDQKEVFLVSCLLSFLALSALNPLSAHAASSCDVNADGSTNVTDVQLTTNQALSITPCTTGDVNQDGSCNVVDVQWVVNAALTGSCGPSGTGSIRLPIEVVGPDGFTKSVPFTIPSNANLSGTQQLSLQIHNLKYETEASVQVNNSAWLPINTANVTLLGQANTFGGIGGGFHTLSMTMNLPANTVVTGNNTIAFRFNGTDGITSGFRVLAMNVTAGGTTLLPANTFVSDDPSTWQPPLNDATDITAGKNLWMNAALVSHPNGPSIQAKCSMCHAQDGRDLKYFNYSNNSIEARSMFHGLTAQQGNQIASYIRSLNVPNPGRPWNPPYQPGPGLDSQPVTNWSAGAGLNAVLAHDSDMLPYIMPGGSTATWAQNAYMNPREIPISFPLPDWNSWLPIVHPIDAWGSTFTSSAMNQLYLTLSSQLQPNNAAVYANLGGPDGPWISWLNDKADFITPLTPAQTDPAWSNPTFVQEYFSVGLWSVVKNWELNQQFGLEGMNQDVFGAQAPARGWVSNMPFRVGPGISGIPRPSPGLGNGSIITHIYDSVAWYELQLILNNGYGGSIDWPYLMGYPTNDLTWNSQAAVPRVGTAGMLNLWMVSALQQDTQNDAQSPKQYVSFPGQVSWLSEISSTQKIQIMNGYLSAWFAYFGAMTPAQFQAIPMWDADSGNPPFNTDPNQTGFGSDLIYALPQLRYQGVNTTLLSQVAAWASTVWPGYNWSADLNTSCSVHNLGQITCP